jgi:hypothetical protein
MSDIENFQMCLNPACSFGQVHEAGDMEPIMTCNMCGHRMCYIHKRVWHEGMTCDEFDASQNVIDSEQAEALSQKHIEKTATRCPNPKCGVTITKTAGCDHMVCKSHLFPLFV